MPVLYNDPTVSYNNIGLYNEGPSTAPTPDSGSHSFGGQPRPRRQIPAPTPATPLPASRVTAALTLDDTNIDAVISVDPYGVLEEEELLLQLLTI